MKVAIIGSRKRALPEDRLAVGSLVNALDKDDIIVSGGCRGIDTWAEIAAKTRGMKTLIFTPILNGTKTHGDVVNAYYNRNKKIVSSSDIVYAFPARDGLSGGTGYTVDYAIRIGKKVILK
jgi:hypothetical protein